MVTNKMRISMAYFQDGIKTLAKLTNNLFYFSL